jgi:tetratricopeptide (TPR) repeat protein
LADIFVSYTNSDREWAHWIAQELEKMDHTAHVHDWEIGPGGDIASWMEERHDKADNVLLVVSEVYLSKSYSRWERLAAQWAAAGERPNFALPVLIKNCKLPTLLAQIKRCELFGLGEEEARAQLADYLRSGVRPLGPMRFPGRDSPDEPSFGRASAISFPGSRKPRNLPLASLGDLFKGREKALEELRAALNGGRGAAVVGRALYGLGGIGKSRLAIEYAWAREADYSALLFVRAENPTALDTNLAALAGASVLDLPEKEARENAAKIEAVLRWLGANPTWLMILDNVDDPETVKAVVELTPRLRGGHVIITARAANFPATIRKLELDVLDEDAATQFLLERTADDRERNRDDEGPARVLARELGGLALGLEQAGAHVATDHIGFARYLRLWNENREKALGWSDPILTGSERTLATTWATSVARLAPESRRLLDRLAMLAPDPIPEALLDTPVPGEVADYDMQRARAGLFAYSLIRRVNGEGSQGVVIHRLVQDFARRAMSGERGAEALREALGWVNAALVGDPLDVRAWSVFDPLAPHALAVAQKADQAGIGEPTASMFNQLAQFSQAKARYAEAEPLYRRALAISEASLGPDHPGVANQLSNLGDLLRTTNRLTEAEPLLRRALAISEARLGPHHPGVAIPLSDLAALLDTTDRHDEAELLTRRALAINEATYGPEHPNVATQLNNLAELLRVTNRHDEAELLTRRALKIYEASYGPDDPDVATALNNLATLLKRPAEAEPLLRRALAISEARLGPHHPDVARDLNNLALLLQVTSRLAEAEPLMRRALAIGEASLGPDHPHTASMRRRLAAIEAARGKGA